MRIDALFERSISSKRKRYQGKRCQGMCGARLPLRPPRWAWRCAAAANGRRLRRLAGPPCTGAALYMQRRSDYARLPSQCARVHSLVPKPCGSRRGGFIKKKFLLKPLRRVLSRKRAVHRIVGGKKFRLYGCWAPHRRLPRLLRGGENGIAVRTIC